MSFDSEFNFTPIIDGINTKIGEIQAQKAIDENKYNLMSGSAYAGLLTNELVILQSSIDTANAAISNYQGILAEINRILSLSVNDKALIYYFYSVLGVPKSKYIIKTLFNTTQLSNPNVLALYNDTTITNEAKLYIAQALYDQFNIDTRYPEIFSISMYVV